MSDQPWTELPGALDFTFTAEATGDDALARLLAGPELFTPTRTVQVDYRVPVELSWWRRVWLRLRRKPVPTIQRRVVIPNASVTLTEPED
jgi:hypothetical protein